MDKFWKKTGWTCMSALPVIISLTVQIGMGTILGMILVGIGVATQQLAGEELLNYVAEESTKYAGMMISFYHVIALIGFGLWYYFGCGKPKAANPSKVFNGRNIGVTVIISIALCFIAQGVVILLGYIMPNAMADYVQLIEQAGFGVDVFTIIASVLLAPIGEELLCRGLVYHYAKKVVADMPNRRVAFWIANAIQALMFGIMHANLVQGIYAFFLGLGLGWLRERYNSLYPAMLSHAIINALSTFVLGYIMVNVPETITVALLFILISLAICAGGVKLSKETKNA